MTGRRIPGLAELVGLMHERWFDADGRWVHTADWEPRRAASGRGPGGARPRARRQHAQLGARRPATSPTGSAPASPRSTCPASVAAAPTRPATMSSHRAAVTALLRAHGPGDRDGQLDGRRDERRRRGPAPGARARARAGERRVPAPGRELRPARPHRALRRARPCPRSRRRSCGPARSGSARSASSTRRSASCSRTRDRIDPALRERLVALADRAARATPRPPARTPRAAARCSATSPSGMRADLDAVRAPTLVLHGRRDRLVPVSFAACRRRPARPTGATSSWPTAATRRSSSCRRASSTSSPAGPTATLPDPATRA